MDKDLRDAIADAVRTAIDSNITDYEARALCRDLKQMIESHERYCIQAKKQGDERADQADAWRARMENKLDDIIKDTAKKEVRQLYWFLTILISVVGFFIATYLTHHP